MRKVWFFMMTTANGFYERGPWAIDWHNTDADFNDFAIAQLGTVDTLLFGRKTYEGMRAYWPSADAIRDDPVVAAKMNGMPKVVFSRTLERADWSNTRLARGDARDELAALKRAPGGDMLLIGSSDLAASLAERGLIDEYRIMVNPIVVPDGKPVLKGLAGDLRLTLADVRRFANGNILLTYRPS